MPGSVRRSIMDWEKVLRSKTDNFISDVCMIPFLALRTWNIEPYKRNEINQ